MRGPKTDQMAPPRRDLLRGVRGLSWWQAILSLIPLVLIGTGGLLGGFLGGGAMAMNVSLARKPMPGFARALAMISVCCASLAVFLALEFGVASLLGRHPSAAPGVAPLTSSAPAVPRPAPTVYVAPDPNWAPAQVTVNPPNVVHATGPELTWASYVNPTHDSAYDVATYEIHRGTTADFTPSAATRVATVGAYMTSYTDTTAHASSAPRGNEFYYMVAVRTKAGQLVPGPTQFVRLPKPGQTELIMAAEYAGTLNSSYPDTVVDPRGMNEEAGPDTGHGAERAVYEFGSFDAMPRGATVRSAQLSMWCGGGIDAVFTIYPLTHAFLATGITWNDAGVGTPWTHPGGDYATSPSGKSLILDGMQDGCAFDATAIVRGWVAAHADAHGFLLKANDESATSTALNLPAGSTDQPAQQPFLTVTYSSGG